MFGAVNSRPDEARSVKEDELYARTPNPATTAPVASFSPVSPRLLVLLNVDTGFRHHHPLNRDTSAARSATASGYPATRASARRLRNHHSRHRPVAIPVSDVLEAELTNASNHSRSVAVSAGRPGTVADTNADVVVTAETPVLRVVKLSRSRATGVAAKLYCSRFPSRAIPRGLNRQLSSITRPCWFPRDGVRAMARALFR